MAIGVLYLWLVLGRLRQREPWARWLLLVSGTIGFSSFFAYLGYGYFDTWHAAGTFVILPCYLFGMVRSRNMVRSPASFRGLFLPAVQVRWLSIC